MKCLRELIMRASLMATLISTISLLRVLLFASLLSLEKRGFAFEGRLTSESHHLHKTHHKVHVSSLMPSTICSPSPKGLLFISPLNYKFYKNLDLIRVSCFFIIFLTYSPIPSIWRDKQINASICMKKQTN